MSGVYDVAIVGGGFVGGAVAVALADAGLGVLVIDRDAPGTQAAPGFDGRSSAIAAAPRRLLDRLGIWQGVAAEACPIEDIRVADGGSPLFLHYGREDVDAPALGYMVENRHLRMAVGARVRETPGITLMAPAVLSRHGDGPYRGGAHVRERPNRPREAGHRRRRPPILRPRGVGNRAHPLAIRPDRHRLHRRASNTPTTTPPTSISSPPVRSPSCR